LSDSGRGIAPREALPLDRTPPPFDFLETTPLMIATRPFGIDLQALRRLVEQKLCEIGMLETDQFPMTQRQVIKGGRECGVYFCLHGPRSVKLTAIADFEKASLICYGSDGSRTAEEQLNS